MCICRFKCTLVSVVPRLVAKFGNGYKLYHLGYLYMQGVYSHFLSLLNVQPIISVCFNHGNILDMATRLFEFGEHLCSIT